LEAFICPASGIYASLNKAFKDKAIRQRTLAYCESLIFPLLAERAQLEHSDYTLIERKSRMRQIRGVKGEAVVNDCESLTTKETVYHRLSLN